MNLTILEIILSKSSSSYLNLFHYRFCYEPIQDYNWEAFCLATNGNNKTQTQ